MKVDIAVIGGGIAAAAAAHTLKDKPVTTCTIAPPNPGGDRIGESLSPHAQAVLEEMGLWTAFSEAGFPEAQLSFSNWGVPVLVEKSALTRPGGLGWYLDRTRFEDLLWEQSPSVVRLEERLHTSSRTETGWDLVTRGGSMVKARFIIDCSGRISIAARKLTKRKRLDRLTAAYAFLEQVDAEVEPTRATLIETTPNGWWYSALIPNGKMVVAFFSDADLLPRRLSRDRKSWSELVSATTYTRARVETAGFAVGKGLSLTDAGSFCLENPAGDDWFAAGDAALAFDPLSSNGITSALWTGNRAANAAVGALNGDMVARDRYVEAVRAGWSHYESERLAIYAGENRFRNSPFWLRRQSHYSAACSENNGIMGTGSL